MQLSTLMLLQFRNPYGRNILASLASASSRGSVVLHVKGGKEEINMILYVTLLVKDG